MTSRPNGLPSSGWAWVYAITCVATGKQYVGITGFSVRRRWRRHCNRAGWDKPRNGNCPALHAAIRKYGEDAFTCEAIFAGFDWQATLDAEIALIVSLGSLAPGGYNVSAGGEGVRGIQFSEVEIKRRQEYARGRIPSAETLRLRSEALKGRKQSEETKAKMRAHIRSAEHCAAISAAKKGKKIKKCSTRRVGTKPSEATRAKMSAWQIGKKVSEETKSRIRQGLARRAANREVAHP